MSIASIATSRRDVALVRCGCQRPRQLRDRPRQRHVGIGERVRGVRDECHADPVGISQVDVGMVVGRFRGGGDPADERRARPEGTGPEARFDPSEQHPPIWQIRSLVEVRRRHLVDHDLARYARSPSAP